MEIASVQLVSEGMVLKNVTVLFSLNPPYPPASQNKGCSTNGPING